MTQTGPDRVVHPGWTSDDLPPWLALNRADPAAHALDVALGRLLARQAPAASEAALRLAVLCSSQLAQGHPCLDLQALYADPWATLAQEAQAGTAGPWPAWLPRTPQACRSELHQAAFVGDGSGAEPLVLHGDRLYLARYWRAGLRIRAGITARLALQTPESADFAQVRHWLDRVFDQLAPPGDAETPDWQKIACATALLHGFSIVTGGPGTGKTTTVVRLLAALQGLAQARGQAHGLRIRLAAPTGKAAARLNGSIANALEHLAERADAQLLAALDRVPSDVVTLHRLLGSRPDTRRLAHHAGRPLDLDVLVVDEASMMDIEMMDAVLAALPADARLVLLGDKDQLASVEAGAVLGELCARAQAGHYTPAHCARLLACCGQEPGARWQDADGTALDQAVVMLRHSHRFRGDSGIGRFAAAINGGDLAGVAALVRRPPADVRFVRPGAAAGVPPVAPTVPSAAPTASSAALTAPPAPPTASSAPPLIREPGEGGDGASPSSWLMAAGILADEGYPALFRVQQAGRPQPGAADAAWDAWARQVLEQQARFQVLCALRDGPWGARGLNQQIESRLRAAGHLPASGADWYPGRPVLVLRNHAALGLANGDIGVALPVPDPAEEGAWMIRVAFAGAVAGAVRWVSPARLPALETVYALTVHKSQGSEFDHVVLVLPDRPGPLLTRELLYTGATRARQSLVLVLPGGAGLLEHAVSHQTRRAGGVWNV